jgi:hypothetical protein
MTMDKMGSHTNVHGWRGWKEESGQQGKLRAAGRSNYHLVLTAPISGRLQILLDAGAAVQGSFTVFDQMVPSAVVSTQYRSESFCSNPKFSIQFAPDSRESGWQSIRVSILFTNQLVIA